MKVGTIEQDKAQLVKMGNTQIEEEDFTETFSPVAKLVIVRTLLVVVVTKMWW